MRTTVSSGATDQFAVVVHVDLQDGQDEAEDVVHVLGEGLLDVPTALGGQRLEGDDVLRQPQQDQHHQLRLGLLQEQQKSIRH